MRMRGSILIAALVTLACAPAQAQEWPTKPVVFITPAAAGNSPDVVTRIIADKLTQIWKQQVVVLNKPGAGGMLAAQAAAAVENDGYSLYAAQSSTFNVLPVDQEGKMPFDLAKTFVAIGLVGEQPIAVGVNKDVPVKTVAELIALANKSKDGMLFGATNRGGQAHLTGELFRDRSKANISFVHAAGAAVSLNDVIAGRIPLMFEALAGPEPRHPERRRARDRRGFRQAAAQSAGPADRCGNCAGRGVERLDRADGAGRHARCDHQEGQRRSAQGDGDARRDRALPCPRHL